jgi:hypothetical protein
MRILNLTQHPATPEQKAQGVEDLPALEREQLIRLLTFETIPSSGELKERAEAIACLCYQRDEWARCEEEYARCDAAMIGGAPYLMAPLERALLAAGIKPLYAFSQRVSEEKVNPDGSVIKTQVFKHLGFVEAAQ